MPTFEWRMPPTLPRATGPTAIEPSAENLISVQPTLGQMIRARPEIARIGRICVRCEAETADAAAFAARIDCEFLMLPACRRRRLIAAGTARCPFGKWSVTRSLEGSSRPFEDPTNADQDAHAPDGRGGLLEGLRAVGNRIQRLARRRPKASAVGHTNGTDGGRF